MATQEALLAKLRAAGPFDLVYERYSLWGWAGMHYAQETRTPGILEVNAPLIEEQRRHRTLVHADEAERIAGRAFTSASAVVTVSRPVADYVKWQGAAERRVQVVPNGVDPGRFPDGLKPSLPASDGVFTVGFVGSMKPWHGLPVLVEAFARLHQESDAVRLLVVGAGTESDSVAEDVHQRGVGKAVEVTGAVSPGEIPALLASMDVGTAPYTSGDGFYFSPLKVYEYMAAGLPVVASDIGTLLDVVVDGETGLLCRAGDAGELAAALNRLRLDPALRRRLGIAGRAKARREHTWDTVARRILALARESAQLPRALTEASD
jgi:glycosyltransferase involved in cell wall biosynthesis